MKTTFEDGMTELERLVENLESGKIPLEECFAAYEKGVALAKKLKKTLSEGEARLVALKAELDGVREIDISGEIDAT